MRTGRFEESLKSIKKAFDLLEIAKLEFGTDIAVVKAKFYLLQSNVEYVIGNHEASFDSATAGIKCVDNV